MALKRSSVRFRLAPPLNFTVSITCGLYKSGEHGVRFLRYHIDTMMWDQVA